MSEEINDAEFAFLDYEIRGPSPEQPEHEEARRRTRLAEDIAHGWLNGVAVLGEEERLTLARDYLAVLELFHRERKTKNEALRHADVALEQCVKDLRRHVPPHWLSTLRGEVMAVSARGFISRALASSRGASDGRA